ncbi:MAG TPA: hypothetical protein VMR06_16425 [Dokdonella sp.]|uniref:hypothetical protein n=1 Tax=Dokdonella sp. TaxID=2291710 RepID=UPI002BE18CA9|nr:hypothetical protein [Dokdonella sp.]HUD43576.1 hypothetical protein [Dokdonella sp.]
MWLCRPAAPARRVGPLIAALLSLAAGAAPAATFLVDSTADGGSGSLRAAIAAANANPAAPHRIEFSLAPDSTITLTAPLPTTSAALTIDGGAVPGLVIDGAGAVRPFTAGFGVSLGLRALTVRNGLAPDGLGGCVRTDATLVLEQVVLERCVASSSSVSPARGGALWVGGLLLMTASTIVDSQAVNSTGVAVGGAAHVNGSATIERSTFRGNLASSTTVAVGGALNAGSLSMTRSQFIGNRSENPAIPEAAYAGAVRTSTDGTSTIRQSLFFDNTAAQGAAIEVKPLSAGATVTLTLSNVTLAGNHGGPALALTDAVAQLKNNSFWKNASRETLPAHLAIEGPGMRFTAASNNLFAPTADARLACAATNVPADLSGTQYNLFADLSCDFIFQSSFYAPDIGPFIRGLRRTGSTYHDIAVVDFFAGARAVDGGQDAIAPGADSPFACTAGDARDEDRPVDGDADGVDRCDIGALELQHEAPLFADDLEVILLR